MKPNIESNISIRTYVYPNTEYWDLVQKMSNRMGTSEQKYGPVDKSYPHDVDALACLEERIELYKKDGNTEWLIDAANFAIIEAMRPSHEEAHFRATEAIESPGLRFHVESATV